MQKTFYLAALSAGLAGCSTTPDPIGGAEVQAVGLLPAPTQSDVFGAVTPYHIGPYDELTIDVFGVPELSNRKVRVDASGQIAFPLIGTLKVAGLEPEQVSTLIEDRLRGEYVRAPQVTIALEQSVNRSVTVYGEVQQPGVYPVVGTSSLLKAVASARGLAEYANSRDVVVLRTVNGQRLATLYDIGAISRGYYGDPVIYANDTVVVGQSDARRLFDDVVGAATVLLTPLTILLQQ